MRHSIGYVNNLSRHCRREDASSEHLPADGTTPQFSRHRVRFSVAETFSGGAQAYQVVYTNQQGSTCGLDFHEGQEYLVFTNVNKGELWTSRCTRTTLLKAGTENEAFRWMRSRMTAPLGSEM